ncbi:hypothetical protein C2S51_010880 [Perilla frutescens var. frutescens]|nr:hypothetical protein C2S51_010880 [Perilla frutescens var. frutescens]
MENLTSDDEMLEAPESIDEVIENLTGNNFLKRDCGDYYEMQPTGVMMNNDKFTWVAGLEFLDECDVKVDQPLIIVPPLVLKIPKKMPADMTVESLMQQVIAEALAIFCANARRKEKAMRREALKKAKMEKKSRITCGEKKPQGFGGSSNSIVRDQTADAEVHNMEQEPLTNNLAMEELNSALDDCAKGNCAACVHSRL